MNTPLAVQVSTMRGTISPGMRQADRIASQILVEFRAAEQRDQGNRLPAAGAGGPQDKTKDETTLLTSGAAIVDRAYDWHDPNRRVAERVGDHERQPILPTDHHRSHCRSRGRL
jgi:hypothetical protein